MKLIERLAVAVLLFACGLSLTHAQTTGSIFALTGDYIKIGVSDYGTIGSKGNTSPGILYDNTGTRTFNTSYDYLTPGTPFEGFTVKYTNGGGTVITQTNNNTGATAITGGILTNYSGIAYSGTTFDNRAVWTGNGTGYSLINDVRFNNNQKFVDITTTLTSSVAMTNLYFGRFTDPDARAAAGDSSATTNTLGFSPIGVKQVVFSEALSSKYALGLYTAASNAGAGISSGWTTDPIQYYNGVNNGTGDYTIGLGFLVPSVAIGDIVTFQYAYIFGPSTLTAGATAVSSGAGGGTAGVVPGCTSSCDMVGVTPPTSSGPTVVSTGAGTPTVTSSSVNGTPVVTTSSSIPVNTRSGFDSTIRTVDTVTTTTPVTTTTTTTPVTVTTYSDGSTVSVAGTPVVTTATANTVSVTNTTTTVTEAVSTVLPVITASLTHHTPSETSTTQTIARQTTTNITTPVVRTTVVAVETNGTAVSSTTSATVLNDVATSVANDSFSGRIDQQAKLSKLNIGMIQLLDMNPFRIDGVKTENGTFYASNINSKSSLGDGYSANTSTLSVGGDRQIQSNWKLGALISTIGTTLNGSDSVTKQDKSHFGVYNVYEFNNGSILASNLGTATNNIGTIRTIGPFRNYYSVKGSDTWVSNKIYGPEEKGMLRPFAGVTFGNSQTDAYTELGSIQSARTVDAVNKNISYAEFGVRLRKDINKVALSGQVSISTNGYVNADAGVAYSLLKNSSVGVYAVRQEHDKLATNSLRVNAKISF